MLDSNSASAISPRANRKAKAGAGSSAGRLTTSAKIEKKEHGSGNFDRRVFTTEGLSEQSLAAFDEYIKIRGQDFLEEIDNWFVAMEKRDRKKSDKVDTGLCMVHYIVNEENERDLRDLLVERGLEINSRSE